ncbi:uncharacterized protein LOC125532483 [Triticum urartu]|uniref:uncharacterized protein LOC125532483 n=1 Tax=Triticum urartu TaxID=4572 RepID=UPI00204307C2|nr:uncharacterized protein LOC125532483 [Triticum urartu]
MAGAGAGAGTGQVLHLWKEWGIQVLVLLSFSLQIMLLVMAELRRRIDSGVLRAFVWSAYMMADATAIYVLGHMSVMSRSPEHELVAFWAPFLLLHLGGQDNITAYSIEDNKLWLRHLQTLAVQVAAATYVVYASSILTSGLLLAATMLMFVVGVAKYGERVWALRCAGSTSEQGGNYQPLFYASGSHYRTIPSKSCSPNKEDYLLDAHLFLAVPKKFLMSMLQDEELRFHDVDEHALEEVVEMQLSLMHDVLFTKTEVVHSWCGLCVRAISLPGTAVALLLFYLSLLGDHHHHHHHHHHMAAGSYSKVDIAISYVLLIGALVLEVMSAIKAMLSSWTSSFLLKPRRDFTRPGEEERSMRILLGRGITSVRRFVHAAEWRGRYWSGSMGQHNLLQLCVGSRVSRMSKIARWMGFEDPWNTLAYCSSIPVSAFIKQLLVNHVLSRSVLPTDEDHIANSRGLAALKSKGLYDELEWSLDPKRSLEQTILTWHIGTSIYLFWYKKEKLEQANAAGGQGGDDAQRQQQVDLVEAVEALSNYMLFLLASRPYMLPAPVDRGMYANSCYELVGVVCSSAEDLANLLLRYYREEAEEEARLSSNMPFDTVLENKPKQPNLSDIIPFDTSLGDAQDRQKAYRLDLTLHRGCRLAAELIHNGMPGMPCAAIMPELIAQVWIEILCYAGHRCSAYSHAKQLGSGGELITIAALLVEYVSVQALAMQPPLPSLSLPF